MSSSSSSSDSRVVSREVKTETRNGVTKTITTETIEGPNGEKRTITREETRTDGGSGGGGASNVRMYCALYDDVLHFS